MYDNNNIFAKIVRKEIPCDKIHEDDRVLFFKDINPKAKIHVLGIPKANVINFDDFIDKCSPEDVVHFFKSVSKVIDNLDIRESGYRIISNTGENGNQEVPHFHIHILGGQKI
ncbi:MAG: putative HIT-like protein [Alphaproteobacteria bacterium MarineAlpha5_Bin9]|nr:MAG: putative HIT-like protein [Alphaproteobacteria bacterium MarineAlpha5_Bin9]|tara:strand:+ start:4939 stop:5277 length:339 start_codon:yes stop_codon:yes gene_type:complete